MTGGDQIAIKTTGLSRRFGELQAVNRLNLEIPSGHIYGFLGPNGSGKSTTIRMLCGLLMPSEGKVSVLGIHLPEGSERLRQEIGYMTQKFSLYEDLSIIENLKFIGSIYAIPHKERKARFRELLKDFNLGDRVCQRAGTLSGGLKQRLSLAAATMHKPRLLFLDEPTSAVDPQNRRGFWEKLFRLTEQGTTIVVSTHYMDEAERCHKLAILDGGEVVADGSPTGLCKELSMHVIEVTVDDPSQAKLVLTGKDKIFSVTQLGIHLRVLVPKSNQDPEGLVTGLLAQRGITARLKCVAPSLEDVFVTATDMRRKEISS